MYKLTRSLGGDWIAASDGCAKMGGLILHAIVFALLSHFVWKMLMTKKKSTYGTTRASYGQMKLIGDN
jgi:hypothetical protein